MRTTSTLLALSLTLLPAACISARDHQADVQSQEDDRVTVGTVQREIRTGMSGAEVIAAMGSPNVVSTDENRNEVWVYDKFATESVHSESSGGIAALVFGGAGGAAGGVSASSGAASKTQRTLTVVIHFDAEGKVSDFAYHSSRF